MHDPPTGRSVGDGPRSEERGLASTRWPDDREQVVSERELGESDVPVEVAGVALVALGACPARVDVDVKTKIVSVESALARKSLEAAIRTAGYSPENGG